MTPTDPARQRPVPPDPDGGRQEGVSYPKAIVLAVAAVVLGVVLLSVGNPAPAKQGTASAPTASSTASSTTTTTTTTTAPGVTPSQSVKVLVANGSLTNGAAGFFTTKLAHAGWGTLTPTNAATRLSTSTLYYASGQEPAALAIAKLLGLTASDVQPIGPAMPVSGITGADVVLVVAPDLAAQVGTTTTT